MEKSRVNSKFLKFHSFTHDMTIESTKRKKERKKEKFHSFTHDMTIDSTKRKKERKKSLCAVEY
jgi:hypothetical protein